MAIENAILFMLVIFTFCALLASQTMIGNLQTKVEDAVLLRDVQIDQIGEDYLASIKAGEAFTESNEKYNYENYDYAVNENILTVWRESDQSKTVVLYVKVTVEVDSNDVTVVKWCYSLPAQTE